MKNELWYQMHCRTFASSCCGDDTGTHTDVIDDGLLEPRDDKVHPFTNNVLAHTGNTVKDDSPLTTIHSIDAIAEDGGTEADGNGPFDQFIN